MDQCCRARVNSGRNSPAGIEPHFSKMKRAVILWDYYQHYHIARLRALRAAGLAQGWEIFGLAAGASGAARDSHVAISTAAADSPVVLDGVAGGVNSPSTAARFAEWLEVHRPDAVILPGYANRVARTGLRWCRRNRKGAVLMFETQERDLRRSWYKELVKRFLVAQADAVFGGGKSHLAYARKLGMPAERCFDGYDVVDNEFWRVTAGASRAGAANEHEPYFFAVGRFIEKKNFPGLIRAFAAFRRLPGHEAWRLVIAGEGPERPRIEAEIAAAGLGNAVVLPGYLDAESSARWYGRAAAFIMPSSHEEQWGLVVNEAMAAGTPVIVSDICGCVPDLIEDDETGLLFSPVRLETLVAAMGRLADDSELCARVSTAASLRISRYSLELFAQQALGACSVAIAEGAERGYRRLLRCL